MNENIQMKELLSMGNTKQVIEDLKGRFKGKNTDAFDATVLQASNYNRLKKNKLENTFTSEFANTEENKIIKALLEIINDYV